MLEVDPTVRHMLLCEDVQQRLQEPRKLNIFGLVSTVRPMENAGEERRLVSLTVFVQATELHGEGLARIDISDAETDGDVYIGDEHAVARTASPLVLAPLVFRIGPVIFPQAGLYWVEFRYNDKTLSQEPLIVK